MAPSPNNYRVAQALRFLALVAAGLLAYIASPPEASDIDLSLTTRSGSLVMALLLLGIALNPRTHSDFRARISLTSRIVVATVLTVMLVVLIPRLGEEWPRPLFLPPIVLLALLPLDRKGLGTKRGLRELTAQTIFAIATTELIMVLLTWFTLSLS